MGGDCAALWFPRSTPRTLTPLDFPPLPALPGPELPACPASHPPLPCPAGATLLPAFLRASDCLFLPACLPACSFLQTVKEEISVLVELPLWVREEEQPELYKLTEEDAVVEVGPFKVGGCTTAQHAMRRTQCAARSGQAAAPGAARHPAATMLTDPEQPGRRPASQTACQPACLLALRRSGPLAHPPTLTHASSLSPPPHHPHPTAAGRRPAAAWPHLRCLPLPHPRHLL